MNCSNTTIKELLSVYLEQGLVESERMLVEEHLRTCKDCSAELALLSALQEETIPDPGGAFWSSMPDSVYREVRKQRTAKKTFNINWLFDRVLLPRWALTTAVAGLVLALSWSAFLTLQQPDKIRPELAFSDEWSSLYTLNLSETDHDDMTAMENWSGKEIASIADKIGAFLDINHGAELSDELAELNTDELDQLSNAIDHLQEEG